MKQKLMLLNVVLLVLAGTLGWRYRQVWLEARGREQRVLRNQPAPEKATALPALAAYAPATAIGYSEIVARMLYARDRNSNVIIEVTPPPPVEPMPALPAFYGLMMGFGDPGIILSEKAGARQKIYRVGDDVGPFKVAAFDNTTLTLLWKEEKVEKRLDELASRAQTADSGGGNQQNVQAAATPPPVNITPTPLGPGNVDLGNGDKSCQANDSSPAGTVRDGMRKNVVANPFGNSCRWQPVK